MIDIHVLQKVIAILSAPTSDIQCEERQNLPRTNDRRLCLGTGVRSRHIGSTKRNNGSRSAPTKIHPHKNSVRKPMRIPRSGGIGMRDHMTYAFREVEVRGRRNMPHQPYLIKARRWSARCHSCDDLRFGLNLVPAVAT